MTLAKNERPFVYLNVAITADGKLAPAHRKFVPFSSKRDQELLMKLRTEADAVMAGARTVDMAPVDLGPGAPRFRRMRLKRGLAEYNTRIIVSGSGSVNPRAKIFKQRFSPIIILTTERAGKKIKQLQKVADIVEVCGEKKLDFSYALKWLRAEHGIKRLLCEGGGEINAALLMEKLVDEIYVTICPVLFGGRDAPTMADGEGVSRVEDAIKLKVKSLQPVRGELYLVYKVL